MSTFKNYFDSIDTAADASAECGKISAKASKIKKRRKMVSSGLGVTLAVMMTTTVAVSAAGGWSITEIIGRWFKGNTNSIVNNLTAVTAENAENGFDFLDIVPNGAVIDDNMIIFFLDVTRNDGNIFDCAEYAMKGKDGNVFYGFDGEAIMDIPQYEFAVSKLDFVINVSIGEEYNYDCELGTRMRQYVVEDGDPLDNKITIAFCCDRTAIESQMSQTDKMIIGSKVIDISDVLKYEIKSAKLRVGALSDRRDYVLSRNEVSGHYNIEGFSTERISGSWDSELKFDVKPAQTVTVKPNSPSTFKVHPAHSNADGVLEEYDYSFNVERITLSQMSVSFDISAEAPEQERYLETWKIGEIIMKNGDTMTIQPHSFVPCLYHESGNINKILAPEYRRNTWQISGSVMLTEPIDPDEVEAVRLGDTVFPIKK